MLAVLQRGERKKSGKLAFAAAFSLTTLTAEAATIKWTATHQGAQEVLPVATTASGSAVGTIDTDTRLLDWEIMWSGITSTVLGLHFHSPAPPGTNADVVVDNGALSGFGSPNVGSTTITSAQIADLLNGHFCINLHTADYSSGELRGQVNPIPVPIPEAMLLSGLALLAWIRRRPA